MPVNAQTDHAQVGQHQIADSVTDLIFPHGIWTSERISLTTVISRIEITCQPNSKCRLSHRLNIIRRHEITTDEVGVGLRESLPHQQSTRTQADVNGRMLSRHIADRHDVAADFLCDFQSGNVLLQVVQLLDGDAPPRLRFGLAPSAELLRPTSESHHALGIADA